MTQGSRPTPGFDVAVDHSSDPVAVIGAGELDSGTCASLVEAFEQIVAERPAETVSLDLQKVSFIDSSGMRSMIQIERLADERGIRLVVIPPPDEVTELLRTAGLAGHMNVATADAHAPLGADFLDRVELELEREASAPSRARAEIRGVLDGRFDDGDIATVVLLTSELVTNAVVHPDVADAYRVSLRVIVYEGGVRVEVEDAGDGFDPASPGVSSPHGGRGLFLVDRCAATWGARRIEDERGDRFCVWFEFLPGQREAAAVTG